MRPRVIIHSAVSADSRIDGFVPNIALYYQLVTRFGEGATLAGTDTLLVACDDAAPEDDSAFAPLEQDPEDVRPLLVVPDSRGRVRCWQALREWGYWRGFIALVSASTPREYLDYLRARHVTPLEFGDDHVDYAAAFEHLGHEYGVRTIRVDSGGTLNGILLRAGLVDEVSLVVHPALVGGTSPLTFFRAPNVSSSMESIHLTLESAETLEGGIVWLRYSVIG